MLLLLSNLATAQIPCEVVKQYCEAVVPPPPPPPPPVVTGMKALFFMETQQGTNNFGFKDPYILAMKGKTDGAHMYKLLHPWYDPFKAAMTEAQIRAFVKGAKAEGYEGVSLDHEGHFLASPKILEWIYSEAHANGIKFINVPAVHLRHQKDAWKVTEEKVIQIFQAYTDASAIWNYSLNCDGYASYVKKWRDLGYTKPIWAMGDDGFRPTYGGITPDIAANTAKCLAAKNIPFSVFNPKTSNSKVMGVMRGLYP